MVKLSKKKKIIKNHINKKKQPRNDIFCVGCGHDIKIATENYNIDMIKEKKLIKKEQSKKKQSKKEQSKKEPSKKKIHRKGRITKKKILKKFQYLVNFLNKLKLIYNYFFIKR